MRASALIAACFAARDMRTALEAALARVPSRSRLAEALRHVISLWNHGLGCEAARNELEESYGHYGWVHTINNAAVVAAALLWGEGNYARTVGLAIQGGGTLTATARRPALPSAPCTAPMRWSSTSSGRWRTGCKAQSSGSTVPGSPISPNGHSGKRSSVTEE